MTTEQFPPLSRDIIREAQIEAGRAIGPAVLGAIRRQVGEAVRTRQLARPLQELVPEVSREFAFTILGDRNYTSAFAAGQLKQDFAARGINVSEATAGDIFHKAMIAGAVGGGLIIAASRGTAAVPVIGALGTVAAIPLVREKRRRATLMSIAAKEGALMRGANGQIKGCPPKLEAVHKRIKAEQAKPNPSPTRLRTLVAQFRATARTIGRSATRKARRR